MIIDARKLEPNCRIECDVCIVGAGPAGITTALELGRRGIDVVVLEAGQMNRAGMSLDLYRGRLVDPERHLPTDTDRYRQLGGTSSLWGGRCLPLDGIDFEFRDHVPFSGWPIGLGELEPYYRIASEYCECGEFEYSVARALPDAPSELIAGFRDSEVVTDYLERWSPPTRFGKRYRAELKKADKVRVYLNAVCLELVASNAPSTVHEVAAATFRKNRFRVSAKRFVLAGGGLEVTRLLLASDDAHDGGIGNHSDWLGRGYQCHISGVAARVVLDPDRPVVFGYEQDRQGVYCRRQIRISPEAQRRHGLLNTFLLLDRPPVEDPDHRSGVFSALYLSKQLMSRAVQPLAASGKWSLYWRHLANILAGSPELLTVLPNWARGRFLQGRRLPSLLQRSGANVFSVFYQSEQSPCPDSRISLSEDRDVFGIPRIVVDYRFREADVDSIIRVHELFAAALERSQCGSLHFESDDPRSLIRSHSATLGHHIGTTRMSARLEDGVVDAQCRIHGFDNVYVASASVFPTSSQANPTLTVVALAARVAETIAAELRSQPAALTSSDRAATAAPGLPARGRNFTVHSA